MFFGRISFAMFLLLTAVSALPTGVSALAGHEPEKYQVVVNSSNPASSLTKEQLSRFFLKMTKTWETGVAVSPVDLDERSHVRETFSKDILTRPATAVVLYWQQVTFSGRGEAPPSFENERDVLAYVRLKPGAIGYISAATEPQGVKVVSVR